MERNTLIATPSLISFFWEVRKSFWRHGGVQRNHSYFELQSLRILKGTVRFFGWDYK